MERIDIKRQHEILIGIAAEFHKICISHNIPYYMLGGTMLGAVRHKGFIPWDDDMDFGIPRASFNKFLKVCKVELPQHLNLLYYDNSEYSVLGFAKLSDRRTVVHEEYAPNTNEKIGINIDVFPLDNSNSNRSIFSYNFGMRYLFKLQKLLVVNPKNRTPLKRYFAQMFQYLVPISKQFIPEYMEKKSLKRNTCMLNGMLWSNYYGAWGLKETISKDVFGIPTLYPFEDILLLGVENSNIYLTSLYGDYMILPNKDHRHTHQLSAYWI